MRIPSGVPGFDALVQGGFPAGAAVVVQGPAGREKDTFLFQFVTEGLRAGGAVLVVLSSVSPAKYLKELEGAGVDVDLAMAENRLKFVDWFTYKENPVHDVEQDGAVFRASIDLANVGIAISRAIATLPREGERRAAVEVLSPALNEYEPSAVYAFAQSTMAKLGRFDFTSLFVVETEMHDERTVSSLHQPFDGVVDIERVREGDEIVRKVAVLSLRGTTTQSKYLPLELGDDHVLRVSPASGPEHPGLDAPARIKENPEDPQWWVANARDLHHMGDHRLALQSVESALNLDEESQEAWHLKAGILDALGRTEEAEQARVHRVSPSPADKKRDGPARLFAFAEHRLRKDPNDPDALFVRAAARARSKDLRGAVADLESLVKVDETYPGLWILKTKLHAALGELQRAEESLSRRLEIEWQRDSPLTEREGFVPVDPETEAALSCPSCGLEVQEKDPACPWCGVAFEGAPEPSARPSKPQPSPSRVRPTPAVTPPPDRTPKGFTNGLARERPRGTGRTNGLARQTSGRTNGMTNGTATGMTNGLARGVTNGLATGMTNGLSRGMTNGLARLQSLRSGMTNGLTNGSGFTNGLGASRLRHEAQTARWKLYILPLFAALLILLPLFGPVGTQEGRPIAIDGAFADWDPRALASQPTGPGLNPNVDLLRFGASDNGNFVAFAAEVRGTALRGGDAPPTTDRFAVFLDTDRDPVTGYRVDGWGADRLIQVAGWGGAVNHSALYEWDENRDARDWRGWIGAAPVPAAVSGSRMEVEVDWLTLLPDKAPFVAILHAQGHEGSTDAANFALNPLGASLVLRGESVAPEVIAAPGAPLLRIAATAYREETEFRGITVDLIGTALPTTVTAVQLVDEDGLLLDERIPVSQEVTFGFPPHAISTSESAEFFVIAEVTLSNGETLGARIASPADVVAGTAAVSVRHTPTVREVGYLGTIPTSARVDGGLAEWSAVSPDPVGDTSGTDADVDLVGFGAQSGTGGSYFQASVGGTMMAGTWIPEGTDRAPPTRVPPPDQDRDTVPDAFDPLPSDFDNDGIADAASAGDTDGDGVRDYGQVGGADVWLNTTIPSSFPAPYAGTDVSVYVGPVERPYHAREDIVRVFIDLDNTTGTGYAIAGLGADRMVEVAGMEGLVRTSGVYAFDGSYPGQWAWLRTSNVSYAVGHDQIEFGTAENLTVSGSRLFVEITNALSHRDTVDAGTRGTHGDESTFDIAPSPIAQPGRAPAISTRASTLIDGNSNAISTEYNHQRKAVRAGLTPDTACDAANSDGCWYAVFYDQLSEVTSTTAASTETITKGSRFAGSFPGGINSEDGSYIEYREGAEVPTAEIGYRSTTSSGVDFPKTRTWDGTAWGGPTEQSTSGSPVRSVRMAWSPTAVDERIIVTQGDDGWLDAYVCTPTCTVTNNIGQTVTPTASEIRFDIAYESASGEALLVYGVVSTDVSRDLAYKTYVSGSWSGTEQYLDDAGHATDVTYSLVKLASKAGGDQVGLVGADDTNDDVNAWIWDGSTWGSFTEISPGAAAVNKEEIAIAWETSSGHLLAVAAEAAQLRSKEYTTGWSSSVTYAFGGINPMERLSMKPNPVGNDMIIAVSTDTDDMGTAYWTGAAWANGVSQEPDPDGGGRSFDFAWEPTGSNGLLVWGDTAGLISRKTFTAPSTWSAQTDVAMGANAHPWVQLRTRTSSTGATLILGAVLETIANDLGGIRWDGTTFTVIGASTFTADTGTSASECFELEYQAASDYQLLVQHDFAAVPAADSYTLRVTGYRDNENVDVQVLSPGPTWTTRFTISATSNTPYTYTLTTAEYDSGTPSIRFVDAGGDAVQSNVFVDLSVVASNSYWDRIIMRRSSDTSGSAWGAQVILASGRAGDSAILLARDSSEPSIAIDSLGFLNVVWAAANVAGNQAVMDRIRYTKTTVAYPTQAELAAAGNWEAVTNVDDASLGFMPTVSTDTSNNPHVAWSGSKTSGTVFYKNKAAGTWRSTVSWGATFTGLSVDVSPANNYVSLVRYYEAATDEVQYVACKNLSPSNCDVAAEFTKWDGTAGYDTVATSVETASYPSLATTFEANGDLWVAYADNGGVTRTIYARSLDYPAAGWQAATTLDTLAGTIFTRPSIGIDRNNDVHALYVSTTSAQVYYNKRTGGSWGTRTPVEHSTSNNPTIMVRSPTDATYGTDAGGLYWKSSASETYFFFQAAGIPEFETVAVPILGLLFIAAWRRKRSRVGVGRAGEKRSDLLRNPGTLS